MKTNIELLEDNDYQATFACDVELSIVESFDGKTEKTNEKIEVFKVGERIEFTLIDFAQKFDGGNLMPDKNLLNIQFGDGSMAFGVDKSWLKDIVEK